MRHESGEVPLAHLTRVTALIRQIERSEARILYDCDDETTNIVLKGG